MLRRGRPDTVIVTTVDRYHHEYIIRSLEAGCDVITEKPMTIDDEKVRAILAVEQRTGHKVIVTFNYRFQPYVTRIKELIRDGAIGQVRVIQVHFSYNMQGPQVNIRQQNTAAGGGIMDVGCYTMSMARLIAGAATGKDFADPVIQDGGATDRSVKAFAHIGTDSRVDEWSTAAVRFPGEIVANLTCGIQVALDHQVRIWGSDGHIFVPNPWFPGDERGGGDAGTKIQIFRDGQQEPVAETIRGGRPLYTIEVDVVAQHMKDRQAPSPCMTWADSLGNMMALDAWRKEVGLVFDVEKQQ
jgi:predicted dehydrogenase